MDAAFQLSKIKRAIKESGKDFTFKRKSVNYFNEPGAQSDEIVVKGIFHEMTSHVTILTADGAAIKSKPQPMVMCLIEDASLLQVNDEVTVNGIVHKFVTAKDVNQMGIIADISLEVVVT